MQADTVSALTPGDKALSSAQLHVDATAIQATPKRKFSEMSAVEQNAILHQIEKQDLPEIFRTWIDADRVEHDTAKQESISTTFAEAMRMRMPSRGFLTQLQAFINDGSNSRLDRIRLIYVLGETRTQYAANLLLAVIATQSDLEIRKAATNTVGASFGVGEKYTPSIPNPFLIPIAVFISCLLVLISGDIWLGAKFYPTWLYMTIAFTFLWSIVFGIVGNAIYNNISESLDVVSRQFDVRLQQVGYWNYIIAVLYPMICFAAGSYVLMAKKESSKTFGVVNFIFGIFGIVRIMLVFYAASGLQSASGYW